MSQQNINHPKSTSYYRLQIILNPQLYQIIVIIAPCFVGLLTANAIVFVMRTTTAIIIIFMSRLINISLET